MKTISDKELENLIAGSFKRKETCMHIEQRTMMQVKRSARKVWIRKWGRVIACSLGWPFLIFLFFSGMILLTNNVKLPLYIYAGIGVSASIFFFVVWKFIDYFSINEVS